MDGLAKVSTHTLHKVRRNLLCGLDLVAAHAEAGTLHQAGPKGAAPPIQSGQLTLLLLLGVDAELARRKQETVG